MAHFDTCGAPICQLDENYPWYPDEEVCNLRPMKDYQKTQLKIQRRLDKGTLKHKDGFFTVKLLRSITRVTDGTKGCQSTTPVWDPCICHSELFDPPLRAETRTSKAKEVL